MAITNRVIQLIEKDFGNRNTFAAAAGIHPGVLERMLRDGIASSNARNVYKLCRCLGISMDGLMVEYGRSVGLKLRRGWAKTSCTWGSLYDLCT